MRSERSLGFRSNARNGLLIGAGVGAVLGVTWGMVAGRVCDVVYEDPDPAGTGWRSDDPSRVFFEYTVGGRRVDIALKDEGRFVAFIEAKAPGKKLDAHVSQLLTYAFHEGVDIGVLTTGLEWWLYLPRENGPPPKRRFATFELSSVSAEEIARRATWFSTNSTCPSATPSPACGATTSGPRGPRSG